MNKPPPQIIVVARHGNHDQTGDKRLSPLGISQIDSLAPKLARITGGMRVRLIVAASPQGIHSGEILAEKLGITAETAEVLWSSQPGEGGRPVNSLNVISSINFPNNNRPVAFYQFLY